MPQAPVAAPPPAAAQPGLWERPVALEKDVLSRRIYAPFAYAPVRNAKLVPVVHSEAMALASWFPLVWRRQRDGVEFVAIRALIDDQRAQPPAARAVLPLALHAYPFMHDPDQPLSPDTRKMLDDVFADAPTDVGASITTVQRKLARATTSRFRILDRYAQEASATAEISRALADLDVFEPWTLSFDIDGHRIEIPDLLVIRPAAFETGGFATLLGRHGVAGAQMIGLHRISLFRAGSLLAMAKAFLKDIAEDNATASAPPEVPSPGLQPDQPRASRGDARSVPAPA